MTQLQRRALWTAIHRWLGLATMLFLLVAAVTGSLLCFHKSLDAALNPDLFRTAGSGKPIAPIAAVDAFQRAHPELIVTAFPLAVARGDNIPVSVASARGSATLGFDQAFLDGTDGHLVGTRAQRPGWDRRHLMQGVFSFHFTLLGGTAGRLLMGFVALAWFVGNLVGVYLTWPLKRPWLANWKRMWRFSFASVRARFMLDLHRSSGLWLLIGVTLLAATSTAMNFFDEAFVPTVNAVSPARPSPFDHPPAHSEAGPARQDNAALVAKAMVIAEARGLPWLPAKITYEPEFGLQGVMFTANGIENYSRLGPITFHFDHRDGTLAYVDDPYADSAGRKLTRALYPLHSGEVGGPVTIGIVFLLGLATVEMCVTGFYVWLKKRRTRRPRKATA